MKWSCWMIPVQKNQFSSVAQSCQDSLQPHGLQHARPPCPSLTPGVYPNPCPLSWWCHPIISSSVPLLFLPSIFPSIRVFSNESALCIRWPKYWSFSFNISPFNEHPELISKEWSTVNKGGNFSFKRPSTIIEKVLGHLKQTKTKKQKKKTLKVNAELKNSLTKKRKFSTSSYPTEIFSKTSLASKVLL